VTTTIAERAHERAVTIRPAHALVSILTWPIWLAGWLIGGIARLVVFLAAVFMVGFDDARGHRQSGDA
jgi:hypothetical protein